MQPETLYKGHTIVPFCSEGPRYKSHYKLTPPGGVGSQWTYLTAEYTTEVAALEAALVRRRSSTKACRRWASSKAPLVLGAAGPGPAQPDGRGGSEQARPPGRVEHDARELGHLRIDVARRRRGRLRSPDEPAARHVRDAPVRRIA